MDRNDALRLLIEVAEAGSFSGVAWQRALATSTVALAVRQLEEEFGARLMTRSTRRLVFTHEGETLLGDARRIVSEWDTALSGLREAGPLARSRIRTSGGTIPCASGATSRHGRWRGHGAGEGN